MLEDTLNWMAAAYSLSPTFPIPAHFVAVNSGIENVNCVTPNRLHGFR
jgi:hypothetical protein